MFEETVDSLRTSLILSKSLRDMHVLAVTSAISGEGKTTIASQLAMSLARATNEPTLLIDGDLRSPDVHQVFDIANEAGLAQFLEHQASLMDAAVVSWYERLHVLPAGRLQSSPHRLLGNGGVKFLLEEARPVYRHIVIDTPPVLVAGETMLMAAAADATILCTMRDVSRHEQVRKAYERLAEADANVVGCVFSGVSMRQYRYRYGRYEYGETAAS
jgi:capsular exopolysaccharide synthesis family protein